MTSSEFSNQSLIEIEQSLKERLNPVKPDQNFIGQLRHRLETAPGVSVQRELANKFLIVALGLSVGFLVFALGKKLIKK